ncbi:Putative ribonuclease H protein At1g65750, partial [Linum perenne]
SNGSVYTHNNWAAASSLIRDNEGKCIVSFATNFHSCSIMRAELPDIVEGMRLAWDKGIRRLCIQTHSKAVVLHGANLEHRHASLVEQFHSLNSKEWEVLIRHIYRESNNIANYLANFEHLLDIGCHVSCIQTLNYCIG